MERIEINPDWPWARDFRFTDGLDMSKLRSAKALLEELGGSL